MFLLKEEQEVGKAACSSQVQCLVPFLEKKWRPEELSEKCQRLWAEHQRSVVLCAPCGSHKTGHAHEGVLRWEQAVKLPCDRSCRSTSELGVLRATRDGGAPDQLLCWLKFCGSSATS